MDNNKSYLKWAGGKGKMLDRLLPILERYRRGTFVEPFFGAGNVSLNYQCDKYILNDFNKDLSQSHSHVCEDLDEYVETCLELFSRGFKDYYALREEFNNSEGGVRKSAIFQYLNKHGYNGLCRYNMKGGYNVPIGTIKKNPVRVPIESLETFSKKFKSQVFSSEDYKNSINLEDSLVYCDPPYVPMGASNIRYTEKGFDFKEQEALRNLARESRNTVIISNHWNEITEELYRDADSVEVFDVQRTISCKGSDRIKVKECVVIYNGQ